MQSISYEMIDEICGRFMTNPTFTHNYGLMGGEVGLAYLCSVMYELNNETKYKEWSNKIIMLLLFKNNKIPSSSLGYGKAGTYWLFLQLEKRGLLSGVDRFIKEETEILIEECKKMLTLNNLDYFEGALGILFALNENNKLSEELFLELIQKYKKIIQQIISIDSIIKYTLKTQKWFRDLIWELPMD